MIVIFMRQSMHYLAVRASRGMLKSHMVAQSSVFASALDYEPQAFFSSQDNVAVTSLVDVPNARTRLTHDTVFG